MANTNMCVISRMNKVGLCKYCSTQPQKYRPIISQQCIVVYRSKLLPIYQSSWLQAQHSGVFVYSASAPDGMIVVTVISMATKTRPMFTTLFPWTLDAHYVTPDVRLSRRSGGVILHGGDLPVHH